MKKIIVIFILTIINSYADYSSSGSGNSKGEAYIKAMSNAPSGSHWILHSINYSIGYSNKYICTVIWKQK